MSEELVSIIIPSYNTNKEILDCCIQSILKQTYQNFEVILIDDGSQVEYAIEMDSMYESITKIHIIHQINKGVSEARNLGVKLSKGDYVIFIDADDCINANWLFEAVKLAETKNIDIVYGKVCRISDYTILPIYENYDNFFEFEIYERDKLWLLQNLLLLNNYTPLKKLKYLDIGPYGKLFKRSIVENVCFPKDIHLGEDQVFNHLVINHCNRCCICDFSSYYYYVGNNKSVSHGYHKNAVETMINTLILIGNNLINDEQSINEFYFCILHDLSVKR